MNRFSISCVAPRISIILAPKIGEAAAIVGTPVGRSTWNHLAVVERLSSDGAGTQSVALGLFATQSVCRR